MNQWGPNGPQGPMRIVVGNVVIDTQPVGPYPPQYPMGMMPGVPMQPPYGPVGPYPMQMQPMPMYAPMQQPVPYVPAGVYAATPTGVPATTHGAVWPPALPSGTSSSNASSALAPVSSNTESGLAVDAPPANPAAQGAFLLGLSVAVTTVAALTVVGLGVFAPGLLLVTGGIVAASTTAGIRLLAQGRKASTGKVGLDPALQHRLLQIAMASHGKLTVTTVAHSLTIPMEEAERALNAMSKSGYVDVEVDPESGVVQYVFREIAPQGSQPGSATG